MIVFTPAHHSAHRLSSVFPLLTLQNAGFGLLQCYHLDQCSWHASPTNEQCISMPYVAAASTILVMSSWSSWTSALLSQAVGSPTSSKKRVSPVGLAAWHLAGQKLAEQPQRSRALARQDVRYSITQLPVDLVVPCDTCCMVHVVAPCAVGCHGPPCLGPGTVVPRIAVGNRLSGIHPVYAPRNICSKSLANLL
jgi:hypothetical protein